ncbi:sigma-70 family RNA polymerase sigma factor [Salinimonas sp. HHU 13199]|uniref:Sigma-70 family RNA polymerase sigma factor n=1 Tax=Salinimonas profundi TaxID=2729140 RepID=A0ABR8LML5_9ALTE|nr:sigma-70 family RNA polymerase sigma factor [Salinimonas profundi]MBD3586296.1 sigma-70 family RNA polymerase sigma factor [Salinimonas profundi]
MEQEELLPLLYRIGRGEQQAFASLYEKTHGHLYAVLLKMLRQRELAEEALQDAFVQIWRHADSYHRGRGTVLTWMISIARYRALDIIRYKKVRPEQSLEDDISIGDNTQINDEKTKLYHCIEELDNDQRQAISLAYFHGLSHEQVKHHLGSPLGTVKSWIRRGLNNLMRCLSL